jgi:hypothetical protein
MPQIFPGRYTAQTGEPFVVFIIGMRINRFLQFNKWIPASRAMPAMISELQRHPELGLLHAEFFLYWRGVAVLQYWKSFEHLHAYAHAKNAEHLPAWADFNRRVGSDGTVGIWHETYEVKPGQFEAIYANMPRFGLARAMDHLLAVGRLGAARDRMSAGRTDSGDAG